MIDGTGMPQSAVLLGGTSEIGLAIAEELASRRLERLLLAGRNQRGLDEARDRLLRAGIGNAVTATCDVTRASDVSALPAVALEALGVVDLLVVAVGDLGTADLTELDTDRVFEMFAANTGGPAAAMIGFAATMVRQGYGRIVVLSSVAGLRVRRANFVYGAGKAGLDGFSLGLAEALEGTGVGVTLVRPGFVRTRMTAGLPEAPLSCEASQVAQAVVRALEQRSGVVYVPSALQPAFGILRLLPRSLFAKVTR